MDSYNRYIDLKPMAKRYLDDVIMLLEDPDVKEMLGEVHKPSLSNFTGNYNRSFVVIDETQNFLGMVELFNISWETKRAELSIALKTSTRGKGYGLEALSNILDIGFFQLELNRIWLRVLRTNHRAISLYEGLGFVREGLTRKNRFRNGQNINQIQMSILHREWKKESLQFNEKLINC